MDIRNLVTQCLSLQYLELELVANISENDDEAYKVCNILDAMNGGLFDTRNCKRDSLKIQIKGWMLGSEVDECVRRLDQIVNLLARSDVQDFMIMIDIEKGGNTEDDKYDNLTFVDLEMFSGVSGAHVFMEKNNDDKGMLIITNEDCHICGYSESWMM